MRRPSNRRRPRRGEPAGPHAKGGGKQSARVVQARAIKCRRTTGSTPSAASSTSWPSRLRSTRSTPCRRSRAFRSDARNMSRRSSAWETSRRSLRDSMSVNITHNNVERTFDVLASVQDADLASVAGAVESLVRAEKPTLPGAPQYPFAVRSKACNRASRGSPMESYCGCARLLADGDELPVVDGPADRPRVPPRRHRGHRLEPISSHRQRSPCRHSWGRS